MCFFFAITNYYHYNSVRFSGHSVHTLQIPTKDNNRVMFIHTFNLLRKVLCFPLAPPLLSWLPPSCPITSSSSSRCQPTDRSELPDGRSHPRRLLRGRPLRHEGPQPELPHWGHVNAHTHAQTENANTRNSSMTLLPFTSLPLRSITKTVVNPEIRREMSENQKVAPPSLHFTF